MSPPRNDIVGGLFVRRMSEDPGWIEPVVVVEPVVNLEKLYALLAEQCESESLDYKDLADLGDTATRVEIAKDAAAMQARGGYLVIGVDNSGRPTGSMTAALARQFDEARLRPALAQYLAEPITVLSAQHEIKCENESTSMTVVVVYVAPHPDGFAVIERLGQYQQTGKNRQVTVFRPGDVFVRHGTSSERWKQSDLPALFARRDHRIREEIRTEFAGTLAVVRRGAEAQQVAEGPVAAFTWQLDEATFDATAIELIRREDRAPLHLLLLRVIGDADTAANAEDLDGLNTILDRLTSLTAIALTLADSSVRDDAVRALLDVYRLGFTGSGSQREDLAIRPAVLWAEVVSRVEALGALAVRLADWSTVRLLTLQRPDAQGIENYASWLRHGLTTASRENAFPRGADGQSRGALVALARNHVHRLPALRPDRLDDSRHDLDLSAPPSDRDPLLDSICQFDLLWGLIAMTASGDPDMRQFYPSYAIYYAARIAPVILRLIDDSQMRQQLFPGEEQAGMHPALAESLRLARTQSWTWHLDNPRIEDFLHE
jgi:hypothetical protein